MTGGGDIAAFLSRRSWRLDQCVDLGMTARVLVVEGDGDQWALKVGRPGDSRVDTLRREYQVLKFLGTTSMRRHIPRVVEWLPEINGFLMSYLRYPTRGERQTSTWIPDLAYALRTLHNVGLPPIPGLADDRPEVGAAVVRRFRTLFATVLRQDGFWAGLAEEDRPKLNTVRDHYPLYAALLSQAEDLLGDAQVALIHGDLAGDNLMLTREGDVALADWGSARIGAALTDAASLSVYASWSPQGRRRFYQLYLDDALGAGAEALHCLQILARLHRYRSCVQSLLWLNEDPTGLDAVGRAYFEGQLGTL